LLCPYQQPSPLRCRQSINISCHCLENSNALHDSLPTRLRLSIDYMVGRRHSHIISKRQQNKPSYYCWFIFSPKCHF
jgi:hypothetical protein